MIMRQKRVAIFTAPICNHLAALLMDGLNKSGYALFANSGWCCGTYDSRSPHMPPALDWSWCNLLSDDQLLRLAAEPDVVTIGTVRYESPDYWVNDGDGFAVNKAAEVQLQAAQCGLIDIYVDDGDYDAVYSQMRDVPLYFKREPTSLRAVRSLTFGLCPWLPVTSPGESSELFLSACFPYAERDKWNRLKTLSFLSQAFGHLRDVSIGPVPEPVVTPRFHATGKRQGTAYLKTIQQSSSSLSLPGEGWDTFRFWEILASGSCLLSPRQVLCELAVDPAPKDREEYLGFESDEELIDLLRYYRHKRHELLQIARSGQKWAMEHHSSLKRAKKVMGLVADRLELGTPCK